MLVEPQYENKIAEATRLALAAGQRILEIHYLEPGDYEHVKNLLSLFKPHDGVIADMGCGVGEVARIMERINPNLSFVLINNNQWQLQQCNGDILYADMHDTGIEGGSMDGVMFNYSIGYCDLERVMQEAWRILRPDGVLFIYDISGECESMGKLLEYHIHRAEEVCNAAVGFVLDSMIFPKATHDHFLKVLDDQDMFNQLFIETRPTAWRFIKENRHG